MESNKNQYCPTIFSKAARVTIIGERVGVLNKVDHALAAEVVERVIERYADSEIDAVYLIYNEFKNVMMQTLRVEKLLPLDPAALAVHEKSAAPASSADAVDYIYEQPAAEIFNKLVPRYVEMQIYRMLAESSAAEHAARMTAMESATSNASDVIDALTLHMNKVRQAAITREIIEVVSGAASAG